MDGQPLSGIRVIDLSHSWAAPHCSRILADFGAEVVKIEYVKRLCLLRGARKDDRRYDTHPGWLQVNRNKYSVTLDLGNDNDREVMKSLVQITDVVVENSRPGVMKKLGFDYERLREMKKDIIVLSMTAFGATGPYAAYAGYGAVMEGVGGIQDLTAYEKGGRPMRIKELDVTNGIAGAGAVLTALMHREKTGEGQHIDLSQLEAATHGLIGEHLLEFVMNGTKTLPLGNRHRSSAPQGCYRCAGEDKWIALTVRSDEEWERFCSVLGHPEWSADPRYATGAARQAHHDELDGFIEQWTAQHAAGEIMHLLQRHGIPAGAVLDAAEVCADSHLEERRYFAAEAGAPECRFMGMPFRLSKGGGAVRRPGPGLGRDNELVICGMLGLPAEAVRPVREDEIRTAFDAE